LTQKDGKAKIIGFKNINMVKTKTTADLLVHHAAEHLAEQERNQWTIFSLHEIATTIAFSLAGIVVLLIAFSFLQHSFQSNTPSFYAKDSLDYTAQQNFYAKEYTAVSIPEHTIAKESVHAAAEAREASRTINIIGFLLIIFVLWYLHQERSIFESSSKPKFKIRRIQ